MTHFVRVLLISLLFVGISTAYAQTEIATQDTAAATAAETATDMPKYGPLFQLEIKDQAAGEGFRGMKVTKKFARRLPNFYNQVVSDAQRDKVYEIQEAYFKPIEMLTLRLERLKAEREEQIEAVLTSEQKTKIEALKNEAAELRATKRAANTD